MVGKVTERNRTKEKAKHARIKEGKVMARFFRARFLTLSSVGPFPCPLSFPFFFTPFSSSFFNPRFYGWNKMENKRWEKRMKKE